MKLVYNTGEIAHLWANQTQEEARNNNKNLYFEGRTIYSYGKHFPIAVLNKNNSNIVYFTTDTYSNTTAKHIHYVQQAANNKEMIYCKNPDQAERKHHHLNLESFDNFCKSIIKYKLINARKPEIYLNQIETQKNLFIRYVEHFKIKKSIYKKYKYIFVDSKDLGIKITKKEVLAQIRYKKKKELELVKLNKQEIISFKNFERSRIYNRVDNDYLRYNENTNSIETSQEIVIPINIAKKTYCFINKIITTKTFKNTYNHSILNYKINQINANFIVVGCHKVELSEINKMAKKLKW